MRLKSRDCAKSWCATCMDRVAVVNCGDVPVVIDVVVVIVKGHACEDSGSGGELSLTFLQF